MISSPTSNISTNESIFKSFPFYIHPKKKSQLNQHLSNSQPYSQIRFFGFLLFQQLFSTTDKMWKVNGFLHHLSPHLKMEADVSHLHRSLQCAATRGPSSLKVYYSGPRARCCQAKDGISQVCGGQIQYSFLHIQ